VKTHDDAARSARVPEASSVKIARMVDLSCVKSTHEESELVTMVDVGKKFGVCAVFALPSHTARLKELIRGTGIAGNRGRYQACR
jgi:deoxyribose-phosphate aldolase